VKRTHSQSILQAMLLVLAVVSPTKAQVSVWMDTLRRGTNIIQQQDAAMALSSNRVEIISALLQAVEYPGTNRTERFAKQLSIETLGDYRSPEAVGPLISNITFPEVYPSRKRGLDTPYILGLPCTRSLIQIGQPSINGIMHRLEKPATVKELSLFGLVIHEIDGEKIGLFRLEAAVKEIEVRLNIPAGVSEGDLRKLANLRRLIEIYRDEGWYKPKYLSDESTPESTSRK